MKNRLQLILPVVAKDAENVIHQRDTLFEYLPIDRMVLIGPRDVREKCAELLRDPRITIIDEEELIDTGRCREIIIRRGGEAAAFRTGWYIQQFLKLNYAERCDEEYYLVWDGDMIPVRDVSMFNDEGRPLLDITGEYHAPYFDTINAILPGLKRYQDGSFIAEHMLFNTQIVREMIREIEGNEALQGEMFYEKILNAIAHGELTASGFSEFETYGTYAVNRFPKAYCRRRWRSVRSGGRFMRLNEQDPGVLSWIAQEYYAVVIEDWDRYNPIIHQLFFHPLFQRMIPVDIAVEGLNRLSKWKAAVKLH